MKPKELQIGDFVMYENQPYQIRQLGIFDEDKNWNEYLLYVLDVRKASVLLLEEMKFTLFPQHRKS